MKSVNQILNHPMIYIRYLRIVRRNTEIPEPGSECDLHTTTVSQPF